jgi:hypothetical protein
VDEGVQIHGGYGFVKDYPAEKYFRDVKLITIGEGIPTHTCIYANAHALARYAALCQAAQIVPIVEPEVLMDGTHTIRASGQLNGVATSYTSTIRVVAAPARFSHRPPASRWRPSIRARW